MRVFVLSVLHQILHFSMGRYLLVVYGIRHDMSSSMVLFEAFSVTHILASTRGVVTAVVLILSIYRGNMAVLL